MVRIAIVLLLNCFSCAVQAALSSDAYRVEAQVENQSEAKRIAAVKSGLSDVIARVSGDAALQHPSVRQAISSAPDYLLKFSYSEDGDKNSEKSATDTGVKLTLSYSAQAIESLLRQAQLPFGGAAPKNATSLILNVDGVGDFTSFKQVHAYLETLTMIRRSELLSANNSLLVFQLTLEGDVAPLKNTLATDNKLQLDESVVAASQASSNQLLYRWQP